MINAKESVGGSAPAPRILNIGGGAPDIMYPIGRHVSKLTGYAPALPTPFNVEGNIDVPAFEHLCDLQLAHGATALIVCGTTGEAPTLTSEEQRLLIQIATAQTRGRIPVIAGAGQTQLHTRSNCPGMPRRPGRMLSCQLCRTTTSPCKRGSTPTSGRLRNEQDCRLFFMMYRREQPVVSRTIQSRGLRSCRGSLGSRMRLATQRGRHAFGRW